jgi:crotonobetainyl-CoA:carnitine CoA-transferase CaiB-like acyl-CoA transferase
LPAAALDGVKVLDLTHHITGPYCTKLLADFGAEVIKIERPGTGDPARRMGPFASDEQHPDKSLPFLYLNTSKHSVTLDLKSDAGKDIIVKLAAQSDILVENFRPGAMASLGLDYESLSRSNPALVMVSISNFGQTGPYRDYEATEIVEYALGGLGYVFGSNLREPLKHALHQAQFKAGVNAAGAASIALYHQRLTGQGQWVDVSVQECVAAGLRDTISLYTYTGGIRGRQPAHSAEIPRTPFQTRDGHIVPVTLGAMDWETVADFVGRPEPRAGRKTPQSLTLSSPRRSPNGRSSRYSKRRISAEGSSTVWSRARRTWFPTHSTGTVGFLPTSSIRWRERRSIPGRRSR